MIGYDRGMIRRFLLPVLLTPFLLHAGDSPRDRATLKGAKAVSVIIDALPSVTGQSDRDRATLLRARILEDLKRNDEALALYGDIAERVPGDEARCRYAALLLKVGKKAEARRVLEDVEHRMKYIDRHSRVENAPMYDWAMKELSGLRT